MNEAQNQPRVIASTRIPSGSRTSPFNLATVSNVIDPKNIKFPLQVGIWNKTGEIILSNSSILTKSIFWPKLIKFAPDCHVQNVQLSRWESSVILTAIRDIEIGSQFYIWFDEDLLVNNLEIPPYLCPINIKGGKNNYVCDKCGHEFEAPNHLKIHLSLNCGHYSIDSLWFRLTSIERDAESQRRLVVLTSSTKSPIISYNPSNNQLRAPYFVPISQHRQQQLNIRKNLQSQLRIRTTETQLNNIAVAALPRSQSTVVPSRVNKLNLSVSSTSASTSTTLTTSSIIPRESNNNNNINKNRPFHTENTVSPPQIIIPSSPQLPQLISNEVISEHQAHLESIVSNMGKAKNGHVCLYCGKLYSRKYGLKIHIRTHTGYKPLACKICHRPFGDPSNLNKHVRLHSDGTTPYRCDICGKVLVRRRDLDRHIQSRHSELISLHTTTTTSSTTTNTNTNNNNLLQFYVNNSNSRPNSGVSHRNNSRNINSREQSGNNNNNVN